MMVDEPSARDANEETARHQTAPDGKPQSLPPSRNDGDNNTSTAEHNPYLPNWVEQGTLVVLFLAFLAACYAGYEADRLAAATESALSDARIVAKQAHSDNVALLVSQTRPWVNFGLDPASISLKKGLPFSAMIQWTNIGHSPALKVRMGAITKPIVKGDNPPEPMTSFQPALANKTQSSGILLPGPPATLVLMSDNPMPLSDTDVANVKDGVVIIWVTGRAEYDDVSGNSHYTMFRGAFDPKIGNFTFATEGNDAT